MKNILLFILFICSSNIIKAQDTLSTRYGENKYIIKSNPRLSNPFGININLLGQTEYLSLSVDYFVTSSLDIELGTGLSGSFGGIKYHFYGAKNDKNWTPYLGVYLARIPHTIDSTGSTTHVYIPLGIQLHRIKGGTFGVEITYRSFSNYNSSVGAAFKFGHHF